MLEYHTALFAMAPAMRKAVPPKPPVRNGLVIAVGDSWVDNPYVILGKRDLRGELSTFGYQVPNEIPNDLCHYEKWGKAELLLQKIDKICEVIKKRIRGLPQGTAVRAIVLSAGGNDSRLAVERGESVGCLPTTAPSSTFTPSPSTVPG